MTAPRAPIPADSADHPLRRALFDGERAHARSGPALHHLLAAPDLALIEEAVVVRVRGMLTDLARQIVQACPPRAEAETSAIETVLARLMEEVELRAHCQALALEWRLAQRLEGEIALDPVLSPLLQAWVAEAEGGLGSLAMAALAAQARFAQAQRRMQLPLNELPAELFHIVLSAAREAAPTGPGEAFGQAEARLRAGFDEGASRLALFARLAAEAGSQALRALTVEEAGVALWLSALAARSGESRERTACAACDPHLGRLLLTLRAAGVTPAEAERQALRLQPDADLPRGLGDLGTREAAQWLAEVRA